MSIQHSRPNPTRLNEYCKLDKKFFSKSESCEDDELDDLPPLTYDSDDESVSPPLKADNLENQSLGSFAASWVWSHTIKKWTKHTKRKYFFQEIGAAIGLHKAANIVWNEFDWLKFVPSGVVTNPRFAHMLSVIDADKVYDEFRKEMRRNMRPLACGCFNMVLAYWLGPFFRRKFPFLFSVTPIVHYALWRNHPTPRWWRPFQKPLVIPTVSPMLYASVSLIFGIGWSLMGMRSCVEIAKERYHDALVTRNDVTHMMRNETRDRIMNQGLTIFGIAGAVYVSIKMLRQAHHAWSIGFEAWIDEKLGMTRAIPVSEGEVLVHPKENLETQSNLNAVTEAQFQERNAEKSVWKTFPMYRPIVSDVAKSMTSAQLQEKVRSQTVAMILKDPKTDKRLDFATVLFVNSGLFMIPKHYFDKRTDFVCDVYRHEMEQMTDRHFTTQISESRIWMHPESDIAFVRCKRGCNMYSDISNLFPSEYLQKDSSHRFNMLTRDETGLMRLHKGVLTPQRIQVGSSIPYQAGCYTNFGALTFKGMCGSPVFTTSNGPSIIGMHTAGRSNEPEGVAALVLSKDIEAAVRHFNGKHDFILPSAPPLHKTSLGKTLPVVPDKHPKHFTNFLEEDVHFVGIEYTTPPMATRSGFLQLPTRTAVEEVFNHKDMSRPIKTNPRWVTYQQWVKKAGQPATEIADELWNAAKKDYLETVLPVMDNPMWSVVRPLTMSEVLNGIPGRRFIPRLDLSTACGPPATGNKKQFVVNPDDQGERYFQPNVIAEYLQLDEMLRKGEPIGLPSKMFDKDEPHDNVDKCRKIYASNMHLNCLIRKYFLPLIEIIEMNPITFEIAVGINAASPEWTETWERVTKHGAENGFGGDFSGYDTKCCSQFILGALDVLYEMAEKADYSKEDLMAMRTLMRELVHPYTSVDGLVMLFLEGIWISGNPLTVIINSIMNCLIKRSFFKKNYPKLTFNEFVAAMNYGDDDIGSVAKKIVPKYNIKDFSEWLSSHGMVYKLPDKSDDMKTYINLNDYDFLKRNNVYHPKLGVSLGALDEKSILRQMCVAIKKKNGLSPLDMAALNMESALNEAFFHGEDYYTEFRDKCERVADKTQIKDYVRNLSYSYDARAHQWVERYSGRAIQHLEARRKQIPRIYREVGGNAETKEMSSPHGLPTFFSPLARVLGFGLQGGL